MIYGYARVSTKEQNTDRQLIAFREFEKKEGLTENIKVYIDKQSGKDFNRENYIKLMRRMKPKDVLVIESIDRFGRNYDEILSEWGKITKDKQCDIVVLDMNLLDTRMSKDLTGTLISGIVLQLLSYVAQKERESIKQRQKEGIAAARARGVIFGRPAKERPDNFVTIKNEWELDLISAREAASKLGITHKTFLSWARETN